MMSNIYHEMTSDLGGTLHRIVVKEDYLAKSLSSIPASILATLSMDSTFSPPLSRFECSDIEASEREFASGEARIYDSARDLINALHESRARARDQRGQV